MNHLARFALPLFLALGCGGSERDAATMPEPLRSDTLSGAECDAMVAHMTGIDGTIDRDRALADCTMTGDQAQHACVMAAKDAGSLANCGAAVPPPADEASTPGAQPREVETPTPAEDPAAPGPTTTPVPSPDQPDSPPAVPPTGPSRPGAPDRPGDPTGPGLDPTRPTAPR